MITIVDYGLGNLASIANMLKKAGVKASITSNRDEIASAARLILPGVGAFEAGMKNLAERELVAPLNHAVLERGIPVLGLCLGLQLMTRRSEEGTLEGLGWFDADTVRFRLPKESALKIPHMGWNTVRPVRESPLFAGADDWRFYFVHSYHVVCANPSDAVGIASHGYDFPAVLGRGNIHGVQFHPEKSHRFGLRLLGNFASHVPSEVEMKAVAAE